MDSQDLYNQALKNVFDESAGLRAKFDEAKGQAEGITNEISGLSIPASLKIVEEALKSDGGKSLASKTAQRIFGITKEQADKMVEDIAENGLSKFLDSGDTLLQGLKNRTSNLTSFLKSGEGEEPLSSKLESLYSKGKDFVGNLLRSSNPTDLKSLKESLLEEGNNKIDSLNSQIKEAKAMYKSKLQDLQEQYSNASDEAKAGIKEQMMSLKDEGLSKVQELKDLKSSVKDEFEGKIKNVGDEILRQGQEQFEDLKGAIGDNLPVVKSVVNKVKSVLTPSVEEAEDGTPSLLNKAVNFVKDGVNKVAGMVKSKGTDAIDNIKNQLSMMDEAEPAFIGGLKSKVIQFNQKLINQQDKFKSVFDDNINNTEKELKSLKDKYSNLTDPEEVRATRSKITELNNKLEDFKNSKEDEFNDFMDLNRKRLMNKLGINEDIINSDFSPAEVDKFTSIIDTGMNAVKAPITDMMAGLSKSVNNPLSGLLDNESILKSGVSGLNTQGWGSDSTIARALQMGKPKTFVDSATEHFQGIVKKPIQQLQEMAQSVKENIPQPDEIVSGAKSILSQGQQAVQEGVEGANKALSDASEAVVKSELAEAKSEAIKDALLGSGGDEAEEVAEGVADEAVNEIVPGLGLLLGVAGIGSSVAEGIKAAKEQFSSRVANPVAQFGA